MKLRFILTAIMLFVVIYLKFFSDWEEIVRTTFAKKPQQEDPF